MQTIIEQVDSIIADLSLPLTTSEAADGWTVERKNKALIFYNDFRIAILKQEILPVMSHSRMLDFLGVWSGPILEKVATLSNQIREHQSKKP